MSLLVRHSTDIQQSNSGTFAGKDRRREARFFANETVDIFAVSGKSETLLGKAVMRDISASGACVQMPSPLAPGADIRIVTSKTDVLAVVRHCGAAFTGYIIGVELKRSPDAGHASWSTLVATW
jgi:hypothetical protein